MADAPLPEMRSIFAAFPASDRNAVPADPGGGFMGRVLIFGGTTEGRLLAEFCEKSGIPAELSVATDYGGEVLPAFQRVRVRKGRIPEPEILALLETGAFDAVFDATHPYAAHISRSVKNACRAAGVRRFRVVRPETGEYSRKLSSAVIREAEDSRAAAELLLPTEGGILLTTGSRELPDFAALPRERLFVRVLPSTEALTACREAGILPAHIAAMQGPFNEELNEAMLRFYGCRYLVTKESGSAGGFEEKLAACAAAGAEAVVIRRPKEERGITLREAEQILLSLGEEQT